MDSDKITTKPTIETVLERINALADRFDAFQREMMGFRQEIASFRESIEIRFDRVESVTNATRAEMLTLRADFRELCARLKEHIPALG